MKLYKNKKNPNRGNSLWKLSMTNLLGYIGYFNILLVYLKEKHNLVHWIGGYLYK